MWQLTYALLLRMAQALIAHPAGAVNGPLFGVWIGLYQAGTGNVLPQSTMANILEANFNGYSRQQAAWFPPWQSQGGPELLAGQDVFFSPTDATVTNHIAGVFLADAFYGGNLLAGAALPSPGIILAGPTQAVKVQPQLQLTTLQVYGSPAVVS
jgi:hypothetical protein